MFHEASGVFFSTFFIFPFFLAGCLHSRYDEQAISKQVSFRFEICFYIFTRQGPWLRHPSRENCNDVLSFRGRVFRSGLQSFCSDTLILSPNLLCFPTMLTKPDRQGKCFHFSGVSRAQFYVVGLLCAGIYDMCRCVGIKIKNGKKCRVIFSCSSFS